LPSRRIGSSDGTSRKPCFRRVTNPRRVVDDGGFDSVPICKYIYIYDYIWCVCVCMCKQTLFWATQFWNFSNQELGFKQWSWGYFYLNDDSICTGMTIHKSQLFDGCQVTRVLNDFDPYPSKTCSCFSGCWYV
jgi:hypothetical protein